MDELEPQNYPDKPEGTPSRRQKKFKSQINVASSFDPKSKGPEKTGEMGISSQEFWKQSSNDIAGLGFDAKSYKSNKILPIHPSSGSGEHVSRVGTAQERIKYDKEKQRDPAQKLAAMKYKKMHSLRDELHDNTFSYWCSSAEKIIENSNSHPSFRIYYSFVKRFMIVAFIL